jgi:CRP/FNR family cyclic AMP-dependent transcriptional regulator
MIENQTLQILSNFEIFKELSGDDLKKIHANCQRLKFKEADILMKEGQRNAALYIIIKGQAEVCLPEQNGKIKHKRPTKVKLIIDNEGDFFGEYSFIDSKPASASVIATQAGELIKITKHNMDNILENNDRIAKTVYLNILKILVERLRNINKEYDEIYLL